MSDYNLKPFGNSDDARGFYQLLHEHLAWLSLTMTVMVAIALNTEPLLKTAPHARGQDRSCNRSSLRRTNSASRANLRSATYVGSVRLVTCSKDPIGYEGSDWNLYEYVAASPIVFVDPFGLQTGLIDPKVPYYGPFGPPIYIDEWYPPPPSTPQPPPVGGGQVVQSGSGFWSFFPCGSVSYSYTISATGWLGVPLPVQQFRAWLPVPPTGGGGGASPCPPCYTCCITSITTNTLIVNVTARNGWVRGITSTLNTTISTGSCQLSTSPCPRVTPKRMPPTEIDWTIPTF